MTKEVHTPKRATPKHKGLTKGRLTLSPREIVIVEKFTNEK